MLTGCGLTPTGGGAMSEAALCREWGAGLPTRSRADTAQTADEIEGQYAVFARVCPAHIHLIPE